MTPVWQRLGLFSSSSYFPIFLVSAVPDTDSENKPDRPDRRRRRQYCVHTVHHRFIHPLLSFFCLQYVHNGSDSTRDRFTLVARTDAKTSVPAVVNVRVIPVDDETPQLVNNTGIRVHAGSSVAVTKEHLGE